MNDGSLITQGHVLCVLERFRDGFENFRKREPVRLAHCR
jgi:hypothetical protein